MVDKPTRRQRELLQWCHDQPWEWVSCAYGFSPRAVSWCVAQGWLEKRLAGIAGNFCWEQWRLTDAGRRVLEEADKHAPT